MDDLNIAALNEQMLILFAILFVGFAASKARLLPEGASRVLSDLVVNIACPATTLYAVATSSRALSNASVGMILLVTAIVYGVVILFAGLCTRLFRVPEGQRGIYRFMLVFGNVGFLGYPVVQALFGSDAVFAASMYNLVFQMLCFTYGVAQISGEKQKLSWRTLTAPMIVASVLALVLYLVDFPFPPMVTRVLGYLDRITAPTSMLIIGCALSACSLRELLTQWRVYVWCALKLVVIPVCVWLALRLVIHDTLILHVMVVMSALPVATNATLLCAKYDGDQATAASGVFLSTLLSVFVLPWLLSVLF